MGKINSNSSGSEFQKILNNIVKEIKNDPDLGKNFNDSSKKKEKFWIFFENYVAAKAKNVLKNLKKGEEWDVDHFSLENNNNKKMQKEENHRFPDILLIFKKDNVKYGIEIKTLKCDDVTKGSWRVNGGSVKGSTWVKDLEKVYILCAKWSMDGKIKIHDPKLHEECIVDVALTHYPRYVYDVGCTNNGFFMDDHKNDFLSKIKKRGSLG